MWPLNTRVGSGTPPLLLTAPSSAAQLPAFGLNGVIDGWRCGLLGHKVGDVLEISIPGKLAYGDKPANPQAPAGTLVFYVELTDALSTAQIAAASKDATPG